MVLKVETYLHNFKALNRSIFQVKAQAENKIENLKENYEDELKIIKAEHEISKRDLTMQLEIATAQTTEFDETIEQLKQEIKDQSEDRKIGDKKGQALIKDLKKQLMSEKQRNERLSDKMKEHFDPPSNFSEVSRSEVEVDRTSNSSWSIYSGHNDNCPPTPHSIKSLNTERNSYEPSPSPDEKSCGLPNNSDYGALLDKISQLQEEKVLTSEKLQMLENSASAMADDLVRKSNIIQFYCMDGKSEPLKKDNGNVSTNERIQNVKKVMNFMVNPEKVDAQQKEELHRMQRMLEETLTKNMHLQKDLEHLSREVVRLSKLVPTLPN